MDPARLSEFLQLYLAPPMEVPALPLGVYEHHKGALYMVTGTCRHSETLEVMVSYHGASGKWTRPLSMFTDEVETEQGRRPRYRLVALQPD